MLNVRLICVGNLKESYLREALAEYVKRLGGMCRFSLIELKEARLPDTPSAAQIAAALEAESHAILAEMPPRAYKIALCVEGRQLSSEELAGLLEKVSMQSGEMALVIGSSYGLADSVKTACDMRLSVSMLTFPHQLMRVLLCETLYRSLSINKGTKYHK